MKRFIFFICGILLAFAGYIAFAFYISRVPAAPPLPAGIPLINASDLANPASFLSGGRGSASVRRIYNPALSFKSAVRIRTLSRPLHPYETQLRVPTTAPVRAGDALAARFYVRKPLFAPAKSRVDFIFEEAGGDYKKSVSLPVEAGLRWRRVDIPFLSAGDYPAGKAHITFRAGYDPQAVDIAGFELINRGQAGWQTSFAPAGFYEGREAGAAWRTAAEERIEKIRKGDIEVKVVNPDGTPAPGAAVRIKLLKHSFSFGAAVSSNFLFAGNREDDKRRYKETFLKLFNSATIENGLKWPFWSGEEKTRTDKTAAWLNANGIKLRGHTLIWPDWEHMPDGMEKLKREPEKLRAAIRNHIKEEAAYYRGKAAEWDVLNEPLYHQEITGLLGQAEVLKWFQYAREADPSAKLYVNDYDLLDDFGANTEQQDRYEAFIRRLLESKVPLDGIGLQSHYKWDLTPPARLLAVLDRFQRLGKPIQATELDIDIPDEKLQADYLRDFMTAVFSHPAVEGITLWVFWEGVHSVPGPALYRRDWSKKPAALALEELLLKKWRTELDGTADGQGEFRARGFLGTYEISASGGKTSGSLKTVLTKNGASVIIKLK
ncbi:MAG: endo-1,4-beta-xylanase [Elusimicrobiota bacterium]|nr:endo-1,4-beta-xylanase [Elusimicrobiota bacterium]